MQFSVKRLDVVYEAAFKEPAFTVPQSAVPILSSFHETLGPRFGIRPSDLQVTAGNFVSDVAVRVSLFGGNGLLEVTVERFSGKFQGLQTEEDVTTVKDCIALSEEALKKALPDVSARATAINNSAWIVCEGNATETKELLRGLGESGVDIRVEKLGATEIDYWPRAELRNEAERWHVAFALERSVLEGSHLFFLCNATYLNGGHYNSLDERVEHVRGIWLAILQHFGLEPQASTG